MVRLRFLLAGDAVAHRQGEKPPEHQQAPEEGECTVVAQASHAPPVAESRDQSRRAPADEQEAEAGDQRIEDNPFHDMGEHVVSDLVRHDQPHFGIGRLCDGVVVENDLRRSTEPGYMGIQQLTLP